MYKPNFKLSANEGNLSIPNAKVQFRQVSLYLQNRYDISLDILC